jgi:hypothetical protein
MEHLLLLWYSLRHQHRILRHFQRAHRNHIWLGAAYLCAEMVLRVLCIISSHTALRLLEITRATTARYQFNLWNKNEAEHASAERCTVLLSFCVLDVLCICQAPKWQHFLCKSSPVVHLLLPKGSLHAAGCAIRVETVCSVADSGWRFSIDRGYGPLKLTVV